jgi:hypothetical protein
VPGSLRERALSAAARHQPNTGGQPCSLGAQYAEWEPDLRDDAVSIVWDRTIPTQIVIEELAIEGVTTTQAVINKHRNPVLGCKWCERHGLTPR